jgi:putative ABC transport system substrate-binding protein
MMRRRTFFGLMAGSALLPFGAHAQPRVWRIALASPVLPVADLTEGGNLSWSAFLAELRELGFAEGRNVAFERYSAVGAGAVANEDMARAIVSGSPDLIFVGSSSPIVRAAAAASNRIPILFSVSDALASGLVTNLSRPGANVTGSSSTGGVEAEGKRIELMTQAIPGVRRIAYVDGDNAWEGNGHRPVVEAAARSLGVQIVPVLLEAPFDDAAVDRVAARVAAERFDAVVVGLATGTTTAAAGLGRMVARQSLPAIAGNLTFVDVGFMMVHASSVPDSYRRAAQYAGRILLEGVKPGDLPVQQGDKYDLIINLRTTTQLGLTLPLGLISQATEFIE